MQPLIRLSCSSRLQLTFRQTKAEEGHQDCPGSTKLFTKITPPRIPPPFPAQSRSTRTNQAQHCPLYTTLRISTNHQTQRPSTLPAARPETSRSSPAAAAKHPNKPSTPLTYSCSAAYTCIFTTRYPDLPKSHPLGFHPPSRRSREAPEQIRHGIVLFTTPCAQRRLPLPFSTPNADPSRASRIAQRKHAKPIQPPMRR